MPYSRETHQVRRWANKLARLELEMYFRYIIFITAFFSLFNFSVSLANSSNSFQIGPKKEVWVIDEQEYDMLSYCIVIQPDQKYLMNVTVSVPVNNDILYSDLSYRIAEYAVENGYYQKAEGMARPHMLVPRIGVTLVKGSFLSHSILYRSEVEISELLEE
jgi:hypothetical protein